MIKLENLTKTFTQKNGTSVTAVDNVSLHVPQGEMCVLLGPSGPVTHVGPWPRRYLLRRLLRPESQVRRDARGGFPSEVDSPLHLDA